MKKRIRVSRSQIYSVRHNILLCLLCFLWIGIFSLPVAAEENLLEGNFYHEVTMIHGQEKTQNRLQARSTYSLIGDAYKDSLTYENERAIYQALVNLNDNGGLKEYSYDLRKGITINLKETVLVSKTEGNNSNALKRLQNQFNKAVDAFIFDYSENYWISGFSCSYQGKSTDTKWMISNVIIYPVDYYTGIRSEMAASEAVLQKMINQVKGNSRYEIVKNAHDTVTQLITYPTNIDLYSNMYLHTITGPLLDRYHHYGVCDAYARVFRLICQAKNIPCILVPGGVENKYGKVVADHIWNYVKMEDGKWYLVDATWDDQMSDPYKYFLVGANTTSEDHRPVGIFSEEGVYTPFRIPSLSLTGYERPIDPVKETIENTEIQKINLSAASLLMNCGTEKMLHLTLQPTNASGYQLVFESTDQTIASVNTSGGYFNPVISAKGAGTANIIVKNASSFATEAVCTITVEHTPAVKTVAATANSEGSRITYCTGCGMQLKKEILPKCQVALNADVLPLQLKKSTTALKVKNATSGDTISSWTSSNSKVVAVNHRTGKLTAKKKGIAVVTVTMKSGASASCRVTVQKGKVKTGKLTCSKNVVILKKGKTESLKIAKSPLTSQEKIAYKTQNKKIATVSSKGTIRAKKKGTTYITVKSGKNKLKIKVIVE